jgi:hypothetical protein
MLDDVDEIGGVMSLQIRCLSKTTPSSGLFFLSTFVFHKTDASTTVVGQQKFLLALAVSY